MTNTKLIESAVKLVVEFFEAEGIAETTESIRKRATEWWNYTEIVDAEMLAAATISGSYKVNTSWSDLLSWREFYFPSIPIEETLARIEGYYLEEELLAMENFHIDEIEAAQMDVMWQ